MVDGNVTTRLRLDAHSQDGYFPRQRVAASWHRPSSMWGPDSLHRLRQQSKRLPPQPPQASESIDPEFSGLVFCRVYLLSQLDSLLLTDVRAGLLASRTGLGSCGLYNVCLETSAQLGDDSYL
jgi:hypothetical protein